MGQIEEFFRNRRVLVTGGAGLIGSAFVERLVAAGAQVRTVRHRRPIEFLGDVEVVDGDLINSETCKRAASGVECVIHAAGVNGGSKNVAVRGIPMFTDNLLMNTQMLEAARVAGCRSYLFMSNSSVYAKSEAPLREEDAWGDTSRSVPENETGMVKRAGEAQCALYSRFTQMRIAIIRAGNAFGPRDNFDLEASHVVPALIRKAVEKHDPYLLWGTGEAARDFIHSSDIARGGLFLLARARPHECAPINIATGSAVTIRELAELILKLAGHRARIRLQEQAPPASPAKRIDVSRMSSLGFAPALGLEEGLRQTIGWYRETFGM